MPPRSKKAAAAQKREAAKKSAYQHLSLSSPGQCGLFRVELDPEISDSDEDSNTLGSPVHKKPRLSRNNSSTFDSHFRVDPDLLPDWEYHENQAAGRAQARENADLLEPKSWGQSRTTRWREEQGRTKKARERKVQSSTARITDFFMHTAKPPTAPDSHIAKAIDGMLSGVERGRGDDMAWGSCSVVSVDAGNHVDMAVKSLPLYDEGLSPSPAINSNMAAESPPVLEHPSSPCIPQSPPRNPSSNPQLDWGKIQHQKADNRHTQAVDDHLVLSNLIKAHLEKLRRSTSSIKRQNAVTEVLDFEALAHYVNLRKELEDQLLRETKAAIRAALLNRKKKLRLSNIKPAAEASTTVAYRYGRGEYFARWLRDSAKELLRNQTLKPRQQGKGARHRTLLDNPEIVRKLQEWTRGLVDVECGGYEGKIRPSKLQRYVNKFLLPSLEIDKSISRVTAILWLKKLGFQLKKVKKGVYIDGHERDDVVETRKKFIAEMHNNILPRCATYEGETLERRAPALPPGEKEHHLIFHDETCFHANDQCSEEWMQDGKLPLRGKGRGRIIHVSDFIIEDSGRLVLSEMEIKEQLKLPECPLPPPDSEPNANKSIGKRKRGALTSTADMNDWQPPPPLAPYTSYQLSAFDARVIIYPGSGHDPWWDMAQLIQQTKRAIKIFEYKFPNAVGCWIFDCSSAHEAYASDALIAHKMNKGPGGTQPCMRDTINPMTGELQSMVFPTDYTGRDKDGVLLAGKPKGMEQVLQERGLLDKLVAKHGNPVRVCTTCKTSQAAREQAAREAKSREIDAANLDGGLLLFHPDPESTEAPGNDSTDCCMQRVLELQPDFISEKPLLQVLIESAGHKCLFLPKFHCELNPIEMVWGHAKRIFRDQANGNFAHAKALVPQCLAEVTTTHIRAYFQHCLRYMHAYQIGLDVNQAAYAVKKYTSHRRVPMNILMDIEILKRAPPKK